MPAAFWTWVCGWCRGWWLGCPGMSPFPDGRRRVQGRVVRPASTINTRSPPRPVSGKHAAGLPCCDIDRLGVGDRHHRRPPGRRPALRLQRGRHHRLLRHPEDLHSAVDRRQRRRDHLLLARGGLLGGLRGAVEPAARLRLQPVAMPNDAEHPASPPANAGGHGLAAGARMRNGDVSPLRAPTRSPASGGSTT